jgi:hypothetical protein
LDPPVTASKSGRLMPRAIKSARDRVNIVVAVLLLLQTPALPPLGAELGTAAQVTVDVESARSHERQHRAGKLRIHGML